MARRGTAEPIENKRTGKWSFIVDVGVDPETGKRRQARRRGFATKREALAALRTLQRADDDGSYVPVDRITVREYVDGWLDEHAVRSNTKASYRRTLEQRVYPHVGTRRLQTLTRADVRKMYASLRKTGRVDGGALSERSVRYAAAILSRALEDAVEDGLITSNPARGAHRTTKGAAKPKRRELAVWTNEELRQFLEQFRDDPRWYAIFRTLGMCGMRRSELLGLRWGDIELDKARLAVRQSLVVVNGEVHINEPKTEFGRRSIDLDPATVAALKAWKRAQAAERLHIGAGWRDELGGLAFTTYDGSPIYPNKVGKVFDAAVKESELPRIRLHDLRHGHASHLLTAGYHPALVAARLGHASAGFTLSTYAHAMPGQQADAANAVAALVDGVG